MSEYTAEDGLKVLKYLGLTNLTEEELNIFKEKWDAVYSSRHKNIISTTWYMYSEVLPFTCGDGDRGSFIVHTMRDQEFGERLKETKLDSQLNEGKSLEEILTKSPDRTARWN